MPESARRLVAANIPTEPGKMTCAVAVCCDRCGRAQAFVCDYPLHGRMKARSVGWTLIPAPTHMEIERYRCPECSDPGRVFRQKR